MRHEHLLTSLLVVASFAAGCAAPAGSDPRAAESTKSVAPQPAVRTEQITYDAGDGQLRGYLAKPDASVIGKNGVPGVLVVHEWWGHNEYAQRRARELAELGYVAFAVDMYGDGKSAEHPEDAGKFMAALMENKESLDARFMAGLEVLREQPEVDTARTAAIGYCMGGGIVLTKALEGTDLAAIVSFHGVLPLDVEPKPDGPGTHVLICSGGSDPFVEDGALEEMEDLLGRGAVDGVRTVVYPAAVHGFTNPRATEFNERFDMGGALGYDEHADKMSWQTMTEFFEQYL